VTARAGEGPIKRRHTSGGLLDLLVSSRRGCVPLVFCGNLLRHSGQWNALSFALSLSCWDWSIVERRDGILCRVGKARESFQSRRDSRPIIVLLLDCLVFFLFPLIKK
jgi:hypothetical protein